MPGELSWELVIACVAFLVILWFFKQVFTFSVWSPTSDYGGGCLGTITNAIWVVILLAIVGAFFLIVLDRFELLTW